MDLIGGVVLVVEWGGVVLLLTGVGTLGFVLAGGLV